MKTSPLTSEQKDFAREYVAEAVDEAERKLRRKEMAEEFSVSIMTIAAITAWTTIRANKAMWSGGDGVIDEAHEDIPQNEESRRSGGEHFDYNSPVKAAWRKEMRGFVEGNTSRKERAQMKALMLPGVQCTEAEMYIDMGFQPGNITGVEGGDREAREEFGRNASKLGIRTLLGRLESVLPKDPTRYGVVSLDFLGQFCIGYLKILRSVLLEKRAILMTNMMAKRETREAQFRLQALSDLDANEGLFQRIANSEMLQGFMHSIGKLKAKIFPKLGTLRDQKAWMEICLNTGLERQENKPYAGLIDQIPLDGAGGNRAYTDYATRLQVAMSTAGQALAPIRDVITEVFPATENGHALIPELARVLAIGIGQSPNVIKHEPLMYVSRAGSTPIPFHSDFFVLERPVREIDEMRHTVRFLLEHIVDAIAARGSTEDQYEISVRDKRGHMYMQPQQGSRRSDRISARLHNGRTVELSLGRMTDDISNIAGIASKSILRTERQVTRKQILEEEACSTE